MRIKVCLIWFGMMIAASNAVAQNSRPVWSTDYSNADRPVAATNNSLVNSTPQPKPAPGPNYRAPRPPFQARLSGNSADAAWQRQWGPIQEVTGISSGTAKQFIQGVKQGYIEGTAKTLDSAKDWAVILGSTGLVGTVTDSTSDWFKYVAHDVPSALAPSAGYGFGNGLMGGDTGFGSYPGFGITGDSQ